MKPGREQKQKRLNGVRGVTASVEYTGVVKMEFTERVLMVLIGAVCIFCVVGLMKGWTAENFLLIISFVLGTFFPSLLEKSTIMDKKE